MKAKEVKVDPMVEVDLEEIEVILEVVLEVVLEEMEGVQVLEW